MRKKVITWSAAVVVLTLRPLQCGQKELRVKYLQMSQLDELEISRIEQRLRVVEQEFERGMRARGFDPAQDENLALTSSLAKLYDERKDLRNRLAAMTGSGNQEE